ncbi:MAG: PAS domain S-box protein [Archaeoglobus sp.]|uniref:PAS domain S-box protein n=1 Tax=Archaeoglobus sp. TaxID=1872626 RepID=UPI001DEBD5CC|nr:PAS domain S-box protein [Archaeoglobus sp.]MBO8180039.1 PAS domain S-box protein [Archaeoglobus sp.]
MDINKLPDPVIIINQDNKIIGMNNKARELGFELGMDFEVSNEIVICGEVYSVRFNELNDGKIAVLINVKESDFYRTLIELLPDSIIVHDGQKILFANRRAAEVTGIPLEKLIGMPVLDFIHPEYVDFVIDRMKKMLREKKPVPPALEKFVLLDGREIYVEVSASHIVFKNKPAILLIIRDVTEKIEMEKRYKEFFENTLDIIIVTDLEGNFFEVNREFEKVSGYRKEEVIGRNFREFFSEDEAEHVFRMYNKAFRERRPLYGLEFRFKTKYGVEKLVEGNVRPLIEDGKVTGFIANFKDVTERKRLEDELLRTNRLLKTINTINEVIVREKSMDELLTTVIKEVSSYCKFAWIALIDEEKGRIVKSYGMESFDEKLLEGLCVAEAIRDKRTVIKLSGEHPEGCVNFSGHKNLNAYVFPLTHLNRVLGVLVIYSDFKISEEEVRLLQMLADDVAFAIDAIRLERAREESLRQIEKNIEQFAILIDKIRNPLAVITGYADLFASREKDKILEQVRKIEEIIEQLEVGWLESEDVRRLLRGFRDYEEDIVSGR